MDSKQIDFAVETFPGQQLHDVLRTLKEEHGPVCEVSFLGFPAFLVNDRETIRNAFRNEEDFPPADIYRMFLEPLIGRNFQTMEGEEHKIYRKLATPSFKPSVLKHFNHDYLVDLGNELIDRFIDQGEVDLTKQFTHLFPFIVISRLLGIPRKKEADFQAWATSILTFAKDPLEAERSVNALVAYLEPIIAERRENPGEDVISALTQVEVEGRKLSNEELLSTVHLMFSAGATTTHDAMGNLLYGLLTTNQWQAVKENEALIDNAVDETLRWETPVAVMPRTASLKHDIQLQGVRIPAGSIMLFALSGINRDETPGTQVDDFKLNTHDYSHTLSFGQGYRMCPGFHLARLQLKAMLSVLLDRIELPVLLNEDAAKPSGTAMRGPQELTVRLA